MFTLARIFPLYSVDGASICSVKMKGGSSLLIFNFSRVWAEERSTDNGGERNCLSHLPSKDKSRRPALPKTYLFKLVGFPVFDFVSLLYEAIFESLFYPPQFILLVPCHRY